MRPRYWDPLNSLIDYTRHHLQVLISTLVYGICHHWAIAREFTQISTPRKPFFCYSVLTSSSFISIFLLEISSAKFISVRFTSLSRRRWITLPYHKTESIPLIHWIPSKWITFQLHKEFSRKWVPVPEEERLTRLQMWRKLKLLSNRSLAAHINVSDNDFNIRPAYQFDWGVIFALPTVSNAPPGKSRWNRKIFNML